MTLTASTAPNNSPYRLDYNTLLTEGKMSKQEIKETLAALRAMGLPEKDVQRIIRIEKERKE